MKYNTLLVIGLVLFVSTVYNQTYTRVWSSSPGYSWIGTDKTPYQDFSEDIGFNTILIDENASMLKVYDATYNEIWSYTLPNYDEDLNVAGFYNLSGGATYELVYEGRDQGKAFVVAVNTVTNDTSHFAERDASLYGVDFVTAVDVDGDELDEIVIHIIDNTLNQQNVEIWKNSGSLQTDPHYSPITFKLNQNFPNPFNPITTIEYEMPQNGNVNVSIYNIKGELVEKLVDSYNITGKYSIQWNPKNISSGQYFYQISVDGFVQTRKMVLLK